jgi:hypothetical protein
MECKGENEAIWYWNGGSETYMREGRIEIKFQRKKKIKKSSKRFSWFFFSMTPTSLSLFHMSILPTSSCSTCLNVVWDAYYTCFQCPSGFIQCEDCYFSSLEASDRHSHPLQRNSSNSHCSLHKRIFYLFFWNIIVCVWT